MKSSNVKEKIWDLIQLNLSLSTIMSFQMFFLEQFLDVTATTKIHIFLNYVNFNKNNK
jgi:hypothetical protein